MTARQETNGTGSDRSVRVQDLQRLFTSACDYGNDVDPSQPLADLPGFDSLDALKFQLAIADHYEIDPSTMEIAKDASLADIAIALGQAPPRR